MNLTAKNLFYWCSNIFSQNLEALAFHFWTIVFSCAQKMCIPKIWAVLPHSTIRIERGSTKFSLFPGIRNNLEKLSQFKSSSYGIMQKKVKKGVNVTLIYAQQWKY